MAKNISLDVLGDNLTELIKDYADEVKLSMEEILDKTADKILDYIKANCVRSPYGSNHLADSFGLTIVGSGCNKTIFISSKIKGKLVHLIELGFKHKSGKFVEARPFLRPAYDEFTPNMLEDIKTIIRNGGS